MAESGLAFDFKTPQFEQIRWHVFVILVLSGPFSEWNRIPEFLGGEAQFLCDLLERSRPSVRNAVQFRLAPIRIASLLCHADSFVFPKMPVLTVSLFQERRAPEPVLFQFAFGALHFDVHIGCEFCTDSIIRGRTGRDVFAKPRRTNTLKIYADLAIRGNPGSGGDPLITSD